MLEIYGHWDPEISPKFGLNTLKNEKKNAKRDPENPHNWDEKIATHPVYRFKSNDS